MALVQRLGVEGLETRQMLDSGVGRAVACDAIRLAAERPLVRTSEVARPTEAVRSHRNLSQATGHHSPSPAAHRAASLRGGAGLHAAAKATTRAQALARRCGSVALRLDAATTPTLPVSAAPIVSSPVFSATAAVASAPAATGETPAATETSTLLVQLRDGAQDALQKYGPAFAAAGAALQATTIPGLYEVSGLQARLGLLTASLQADPAVRYVEPRRTVQLMVTPNDPKLADGTLYGLNGTYGINAPTGWDVRTSSIGATVADIDTGVDYTHSDLYENIWINQAEIPADRKANLVDTDGDGVISFYDLNNPTDQGVGKITDTDGNGRIDANDLLAAWKSDGTGGWADGISQDGDTAHVDDLVGWNFVTNTNRPMDDHGHGTHTSGTIAGMGNNGVGVSGVSWKAQIMPLKFLDATGNGDDAAAAAAIRYAADHGARVSSNSWGGTADPVISDAIDYARSKGEIFVVAAGNDGVNADTNPANAYPAVYPQSNIIAVAASDSAGNRAGFSNYGPTTIDLAAPGSNIYSTYKGNSYATMSGTSMATPHVAGAVALVMAQHPTWAMQQVIDQILDTVRPLAAFAGKTVTGGLLDLGAALKDVTGPKVTASSPAGTFASSSGVSNIRLTFREQVDPASFTTADVVSFTGPSGPLAVSSITPVAGSNNHQFDVSFANQTTAGAYTLVLGPQVLDLSGNAMDQNGNGVNGEDPADRYTTSFTLSSTLQYDFGTATSPVAAGYTQASDATTYTAAAGYGWTAGAPTGRDRGAGTGTDLTRDLVQATDATFAANVANGTYDVTVTLGDPSYSRDQMVVYLEGTQVDTVSTATGQSLATTYRVSVTDGQLTLRIKDTGGSSPTFGLQAMKFAAV